MRERFAKWNIWIKGLENRPQRNQQGFPPHEFTPVSSVSLARARETDPLPNAWPIKSIFIPSTLPLSRPIQVGATIRHLVFRWPA